jgi:hypothetical protein
MIDLSRYFQNPFDDAAISINELVDYASAHLSLMVSNNPGALLNTRITATTVGFTTLEGTISDNNTKLAFRKARVQAKDAFREALPGNISKVYGAVVSVFGDDASQVTECFPQGRRIFTSCTDDEVNNHLQQLVTCLSPLVPLGVPQGQVDNVAGLLSTWIALLAAVNTAVADKTTVEGARRAARAALQLELFKNLLTLALAFPGQVGQAALYCPQHLLEDHPAEEGPGAAVLSLASYNAQTNQASLSMAAENAESFTLKRRLVGEPEFTVLAAVIPAANEAANYIDLVPVEGAYEYVVVPVNSAGAGEASATLPLNAA